MLTFALVPALLVPSITPLPSLDNLFPRANAPLILEIPQEGTAFTVDDLLTRYADLTGQHVQFDEATGQLLKAQGLHIARELEVPADELQQYVELILIENNFTLQIMKADGIRMLWISSLNSAARNNLRAGAIYLPEDSLSVAAAHPAMLFQTVIELPHCDVRQVSNSMRTMITDANTQQMLPAGAQHSMIIVGIGARFLNLTRMLYDVEDFAAERARDLEPEFEVIALENGDAAALAALLTGLMPVDETQANGAQVRADVRTNSLVISAQSQTMAKIKRTIAVLDR